ncbi:acyltransferase [Sphingomonas sp. AP4-R1]|uniref:acyltransferase family protein n=1 Tax=Sphingomonas sp. AP4-R1 TaxID=2735134 RepID=UPI0014939BBF|nr:acyltransferase [Sphingomonas sp. AP4-R1]QJU59809.1 acyltransferase [Sphingomonas sp. AP4-R1]
MSERGPAPGPRSFPLIQALRGIAALGVLLFHAREGGHIPALVSALPDRLDLILFRSGHYGVPIFFALSGFVIAHSLRDVTLSGRFLGRFILRRSIRLDPPYWGAIVIVILFGWLSARVHHEPFVPPSVAQVAAHVVYLQGILGQPGLNPAFWTLTYEVQFYLFFVSLLVLAARLVRMGVPAAMPIAWVVMTALALVAAAQSLPTMPDGLFVTLWPDFFVGVLAYWAVFRRDARIALALLIVPLMLVGPWQEDAFFGRASALTALVLLATTRTGYADRGLDWRWLQFLGAISYSLYLLHNSLTGAAGMLAHRAAGSGLAADLIVLAAILVASIGGAALYWWVVERTAHRLSRKVALRRAP